MESLKENIDTIYGIITNKVSLIGNYGNVRNNKITLSDVIPTDIYKCIGIDFNARVYNVVGSNERLAYYTGQDISLEEMVEALIFLEGKEDNISMKDFDDITPYLRNLHLDDKFIFKGIDREFTIPVKDCLTMFSFKNSYENTGKFPLINILNCKEIQQYLIDTMDESDKSMATVKAYNLNGENLSIIPVITSSADLVYQEEYALEFINSDKNIVKSKKNKKRYLDYKNKYEDNKVEEFDKKRREDLKTKIKREKKRLEKNLGSSFAKKRKYKYHKIEKDNDGNDVIIRK